MASKSLSLQEILSNKKAVLWTYRHLLRATGLAFQGDARTLKESRRFARESFRANKRLDSGSPEIELGLEHAQGVTKILRENVVQGKHDEKKGDEHYKLRIHEHTQKLDNDTAGNLKGTKKSFKDIKNALF